MKIGYARVSTRGQDAASQRAGLLALGVDEDRIYVDHGLTGTNRDRPALREAMAACRAGDVLVVTKLDRLARSVPDARDIAGELTERGIALAIGQSTYDPTDPIGKLLFNVLAMVAEFESDLIRLRTREGMAIAKAKGRLRGRSPKLSPAQEKHLVQLVNAGRAHHPRSGRAVRGRPRDGVPSCRPPDRPSRPTRARKRPIMTARSVPLSRTDQGGRPMRSSHALAGGAMSQGEQNRRAALMQDARHSTEMEGGRTSDAGRAIQDRWVRGEISEDELIELSAEQARREIAELRASRGE